MKVTLIGGGQVSHLHRNPSAAHLTVEFMLPHFLPDGEDLHVLTTSDEQAIKNVANVIADAGGDFSKAVVISRPVNAAP